MRGLRPLQKNNSLPALSITRAKWIKPNFMGERGLFITESSPNVRGFHAIYPKNDAFKQKKDAPLAGRPVIYTVGFGFIRGLIL